jgi:hypothetical protein
MVFLKTEMVPRLEFRPKLNGNQIVPCVLLLIF